MRRLAQLFAVIPGTLFFVLLSSQTAHGASFNPGRIIDDSIFTNSSAMSTTQIHTFLTNKVPECDTDGTKPASDFGRPDLTHAQYAAMKGWQAPPYTCLRDYSEGGKSSSQIIYDVAQQFQINPQVFIVLLQKETGLVTDTWPLSWQYKTATGYGCPDSTPGVCDSTYNGFTNQVTWAGRLFRSVINQSQYWYSPYVKGTNYIQWSPNSSCGGSTVDIQNWSTAALYDYTPYQPNQAALNAGYGIGDACSAYGNRNFWLYFTDWFGSTTEPARYTWQVADQQVTLANGSPQSINRLTIEPGGSATLTVKALNTGNQTWYASDLHMGTSHAYDRTSVLATPQWLSVNRPAAMTELVVGPGEVGTFSIPVNAPYSTGEFREYFNIVIEGKTWLQDIGLYYDVSVQNPIGEFYNVSIDSFNLYHDSSRSKNIALSNGNVKLGSKVYGTVNFTNTGNSALNPSNVFLGTADPYDRSSILYDTSTWISQSRIASVSAISNANEKGKIDFVLQTPQSIGSVTESFEIVIEGKAWLKPSRITAKMNSIQTGPTSLVSSEHLPYGQFLMSSLYRYRLIVQSDGNLVLYRGNSALWSSNTVGAVKPVLVAQGDGNLVLYAEGNRPVWNAGTSIGQPSALILQDDGNLVIYSNGKARWATGTYQ